LMSSDVEGNSIYEDDQRRLVILSAVIAEKFVL